MGYTGPSWLFGSVLHRRAAWGQPLRLPTPKTFPYLLLNVAGHRRRLRLADHGLLDRRAARAGRKLDWGLRTVDGLRCWAVDFFYARHGRAGQVRAGAVAAGEGVQVDRLALGL